MRTQFTNAWYAITSGNPTNFNKKYGISKPRKTRRVNRKGRKTRRAGRR